MKATPSLARSTVRADRKYRLPARDQQLDRVLRMREPTPDEAGVDSVDTFMRHVNDEGWWPNAD